MVLRAAETSGLRERPGYLTVLLSRKTGVTPGLRTRTKGYN